MSVTCFLSEKHIPEEVKQSLKDILKSLNFVL